MMSQNLPFVMQQVVNQPLMVTERHAAMIAAVLAGRVNISELSFESGDMASLDRRGLEDLAALGRNEAREAKAKKGGNHPGVSREGDGYGEKWCPYEMTESGIAILPVLGTLRRTWGVGPYSGSTGYDGIWTQLLHAMDNDKVKAIWMNHNSPGGAVDGVHDLAMAIFTNSARNGGKPIWAMAADHSYSASYLLASAADKVFCPRAGGVGSIGICYIHAEFSAALEEEGIKARVFRSVDRKARGNSIEPLDDETVDEIEADIATCHEIFVEHVAAFRGLSKKKLNETAGRTYMGDRALVKGLIDDVLSEPDAWMKLERLIARK